MTEHQLFCLFEPLNGSEGFARSKRGFRRCVAYAYGVEEAQRTHVLAALMEGTGRTLVVVVPNDIVGQRIVEDMNALLPGAAALLPRGKFLLCAAPLPAAISPSGGWKRLAAW